MELSALLLSLEEVVSDIEDRNNEAVGEEEEEGEGGGQGDEEEEEEEGNRKVIVDPAVEKILNQRLIELHSLLKVLASKEEVDEDCPPDNEPATKNSSNPGGNGGNSCKVRMSEAHARELVNQCKVVLTSDRVSSTSKALTAQLFAEVARSELGRMVMRAESVVSVVTRTLEEDGPLETTVQICRILGNLCYESEEGRRQIINTPHCLERIHDIACNLEKVKKDDPGQRLPVILPGFLLNFCNDFPKSMEKAGQVGFVDVIVANVLATSTNDAVFNSSLSFLMCLSEDEAGIAILQKTTDASPAINHILQHTTSPEVTGTTLELIRSLADDPVLTLQMARSGLCSTLIGLIESRWKCKEFEDHRSDGCDLLVQILSFDESMKYIYQSDGGKLRQTFITWLKQNDDLQLKITASLSIGNFACNEENSLKLMEDKTATVLISLLKEHQNPTHDLKLQHALLGSLRNLAVTPSIRKDLIQEGLLDPCLRLTEKLSLSNAQPVIYKLLAVLRLVIDGNTEASASIGSNRSLVSKIVEWGSSDAKWLKIESGRVLAAVIKHSRSTDVMECIVECGGMPHITVMLMSQHARMLNEALIALTLMATDMPAEVTVAQLYTDLVINGLKGCLTGADNIVEVKKNCLTLTTSLLRIKPEEFKAMLTDLHFVEEALNNDSVKDLEEAQVLLNLITSTS